MLRKTFFAAIAATTLVVGSASAQDTTVSKGEVARAPSYSTLMSAITLTATNVAALKVRAAVQATDLKLIDAVPLLEGKDEAAVNGAIERNAESLGQLRDWLSSQPVITDLFSKWKVSAADVIAVDPHQDGKIDIYYRVKKA